jgi:hypothetical protein
MKMLKPGWERAFCNKEQNLRVRDMVGFGGSREPFHKLAAKEKVEADQRKLVGLSVKHSYSFNPIQPRVPSLAAAEMRIRQKAMRASQRVNSGELWNMGVPVTSDVSIRSANTNKARKAVEGRAVAQRKRKRSDNAAANALVSIAAGRVAQRVLSLYNGDVSRACDGGAKPIPGDLVVVSWADAEKKKTSYKCRVKLAKLAKLGSSSAEPTRIGWTGELAVESVTYVATGSKRKGKGRRKKEWPGTHPFNPHKDTWAWGGRLPKKLRSDHLAGLVRLYNETPQKSVAQLKAQLETLMKSAANSFVNMSQKEIFTAPMD